MFYRGPNSTQRLCSTPCANKWLARKATTFTCEVCGKEQRLSPSQNYHRLGGRFCSRKCMGDAHIARPLDRMHNGRPAKLSAHGYVQLYEPDHPRCDKGGWVYEHRLVVETALGRTLDAGEDVHHVNGVKDDNRIENLTVMQHGEHSRLSFGERSDRINAALTELEEYRRRYGPLSP